MKLTKTERAEGVLARYHAKVNHPDYDWRKRGNPKPVIQAVAYLLGRKNCACCGFTRTIELHHNDGDWRNYHIENLEFYCHYCHLYIMHRGCYRNKPIKGVTMADKKRMVWTEQTDKKLLDYVNNRVEIYGDTIKAACVYLVKNKPDWWAGTSDAEYLERRYFIRRRALGLNKKASQSKKKTTVYEMPMQEAYEFYTFCQRLHINIISQ